jgi:capsule polysaccharide modification protein KpsS
MAAFEHGDMEKYYSFFDKSATFLYGSSTDITPTNLAAQKVSDKATLGLYEFVSIEQSGYPDYMHYEIGDSGVVYSWWDISLIRKSDKKAIKLPIHYAHDVNKEGKFVNTTSYYNPVLLE